MQIRKSFPSYNQRRYGRPWGAQVVLKNGKPEYNFEVGQYWGNGGAGGDVVIEADPESIVAFGQRDSQGKGTVNEWYQVGADGSLKPVTRSEASRILNTPAETRTFEFTLSELEIIRRALNSAQSETDRIPAIDKLLDKLA